MPDLILVQTRPSGVNQEANPGSLMMPCAYVVFYDTISTNVFGRNGRSAKLDQYNADAATLFNAVIAGS